MLDRLAPWLQQNWSILLVLGLPGVVLGWAARSRLKRGLPVFRPAFSSALINENWASGGRGLFSAKNCVWVSLLPERLVTGLHFPFNLSFPGRLLRWAGLDNDIPLTDVVAVEVDSFLLRRRVLVTYRTPSGEGSFWLWLWRQEEFQAAFAAARQKVC
jgi:hypothetical protein